MKRLLPLALLALTAGCNPQTSVLVLVDGPPLSSLKVDVALGSGSGINKDLPGPLTPPLRVIIYLPDEPTTVDMTLTAHDTNGAPLMAHGMVTSVAHEEVTLQLTLVGATPNGDTDMTVDGLPPPPDAGGDMVVPPEVPYLSVLAGVTGRADDADGKGSSARVGSIEGTVLIGNTLWFTSYFPGTLRKVDLTTNEVTTVAVTDPKTGMNVRILGAGPMVYDGSGAFYVSAVYDNTIAKIDIATSQLTVIAGASGMPGTADGASTAVARFNQPEGLALDGNGNLWVADAGNHTLRKIVLADATVSTPVGDPAIPGYENGTGAAGHFTTPTNLAFYNGDLYVTDGTAVRKVVIGATSTVSTIAPPTSFDVAEAVVPDGNGGLLVADKTYNYIAQITLSPIKITPIAGRRAYNEFSADGVGANAHFQSPRYFALDGAGNAYVSEVAAIRKLNLSTLAVTTIVGRGDNSGTNNSDAPPARFQNPSSVVFDGNDTLFVAEYYGQRVRRVTLSSGAVTTTAGSGEAGNLDADSTNAKLFNPSGLALDGAGNLYVADAGTHCIRRISPAGAVKTIAGIPTMPGKTNGAGAVAQFNAPAGLAFDGDHTLFVADTTNNQIRTVDTSSAAFTVSALAGSGVPGEAPGVGLAATFTGPMGLAYDRAAKKLYVADSQGHVIRLIDLTSPTTPTVSKLAGTAGLYGSNDATFATSQFFQPWDLALDPSGKVLLVSETGNQLVRKLDLVTQQVTTLVGARGSNITEAGPLPAHVSQPWGLAVTPKGLVVVSNSENSLLLAHNW